jgi:glycosyltransferase involved in cell wall biosynthesis
MMENLNGTHLVANSRFSRLGIRQHTRNEVEVVHPPVNASSFSRVRDERRREATVVACGRFSPEKNFESVLAVAKKVPEARFVILGTFSGALSLPYYGRLRALKESGDLGNVSIYKSSYSAMLSMYASSTLFLNSTINESFGLSVVEAMASGLVPVVHRSGGPWTDILDGVEGTYGFSYESVEEAATIIRRTILAKDVLDSISARNSKRVELFSEDVFKNAMTTIVQKQMEEKYGFLPKRSSGRTADPNEVRST